MSNKFIKFIMVFSVSLLMFLIGYIIFIKNSYSELTDAKQNEEILNGNLIKRQSQINNLSSYQQQISKLNSAYAIYERQLNLRITEPLLLDQLAKIGKLNNVTLKTVQPLPVRQKNWLILHPVQLVIVGNYYQLNQVITTLLDTFYFVDLPNIKLTKINDKQSDLVMQALCIIYSKN